MTSIFPKEDKFMGDLRYLKLSTLADGEEIKIRILGEGIVGHEDWTEEKKPLRFRPKNRPSAPLNPNKPIKEFMAVPVWNYDLEKVQIWFFTQKKVKNSLKSLEEKKGDLRSFDIKITRIGEEKDTVYLIQGSPCTPVSETAKESLKNAPINLNALYEGKDPWAEMTLTADEETGEVVLLSRAERMIELMSKDQIPTDYLDEFLKSMAKSKGQDVELILEAALQPGVLPKFKAHYLKFVAKQSEESDQSA